MSGHGPSDIPDLKSGGKEKYTFPVVWSQLGMPTNVRTFEYSSDGLIFEFEINIRIFGMVFLKR
jgi:hypothetical protein